MSGCKIMTDENSGFYLANTETGKTMKIELMPTPYQMSGLKNLDGDAALSMCNTKASAAGGGRKKTHRRHKKSHRRHKKSHRRHKKSHRR
jgi:hypothetical protein